MINKKANHPHRAFAHSPSCVISGMMISLVQPCEPKIERPIKLSQTVQFESIEQMCEVLNNTLPQATEFVGVPKT